MLCPGCGVRSVKLYLPSRRPPFYCRTCHDLSYESAQTAGSLWPRVFQADARRLGCSTRTFREAFRSLHGDPTVAA
ncbi:MAG: hypothetical protein M3R15_22485 [Acidobacteriota bacterium]|nr:hypothetical protein [Acidobacteriota bacterium]